MYTYKAKVLRVYDGDGVFDIEIDMGMNLFQRKDVRLFGVDTPEIRGHQRNAGLVVRDFVRYLILGKDVIIVTKKDKTGKYGRLLADILINDESLASILLKLKLAKPYGGGKKDLWSMEELEYITTQVMI